MTVKICGITNEADAFAAAQAGATYLGYILLYPTSPRAIVVAQAKTIIDRVRQIYPHVQQVGVFVDATVEQVNEVVRTLQLDVVQLHGNESIKYVESIMAPQLWKTIELVTLSDLPRIQLYSAAAALSAVLIDAGKGSGHLIPAELLDQVDFALPIILAGGLNPENIEAIIQKYHPQTVDVNSGVESVPGKKDGQKLKKLFSSMQ